MKARAAAIICAAFVTCGSVSVSAEPLVLRYNGQDVPVESSADGNWKNSDGIKTESWPDSKDAGDEHEAPKKADVHEESDGAEQSGADDSSGLLYETIRGNVRHETDSMGWNGADPTDRMYYDVENKNPGGEDKKSADAPEQKDENTKIEASQASSVEDDEHMQASDIAEDAASGNADEDGDITMPGEMAGQFEYALAKALYGEGSDEANLAEMSMNAGTAMAGTVRTGVNDAPEKSKSGKAAVQTGSKAGGNTAGGMQKSEG